MVHLAESRLLVPPLVIVFVDHHLHVSESLLLPLDDFALEFRPRDRPCILIFKLLEDRWVALTDGLRESCSVPAPFELLVELNHVESDEKADKVTRVWQEEPLYVGVIRSLLLLTLLFSVVADHLVDGFEHGVDGAALLVLLTHVSNRLKSDTLKLEEYTVRKVEVLLARLHDKVDELVHLGVDALQIE